MNKGARVALVGAELEENLGLRYLASSLLQAGHCCELVACADRGDFDRAVERVVRGRFDLLAISMPFQMNAEMYLNLARCVRNRGYTGHIVVGGHFATFEYGRILDTQPAVDSVGRFEGEATLVALASSLACGGGMEGVPNLVYRTREGLRENPCILQFPDLDALPFPWRDGRARRGLGEKAAALVSSRGCFHSACLYCCIAAFHKPKGRLFALRSPQNVAREIALLYGRGVRCFQFQDDNITLGSREGTLARLRSLTSAMRAAGVDPGTIAVFVKTRPDGLDDETADALREMGAAGVFLGVENVGKEGLAALCRATTGEDTDRAIDVLRARGIAVSYNLLLFYPKANAEEILENVAFVRAHPELPFDLGRAEVVAGSPLERQVRTLGLLRGEWPWWDYDLVDPVANRTFEFYRRVFRHPRVLTLNASLTLGSLGCHAALVKKLYPGDAAEAYVARMGRLTASWTSGVADALEKIVQAGRGELPEPELQEVQARLERLGRVTSVEAARMQAQMTGYQRGRRIFRWFKVEDAFDKDVPLRMLFMANRRRRN